MQQLVGRGVVVLVATWVLGAAAPAHADLGDVTGGVGGTVTDVGQTVKKAAAPVTQKVAEPSPPPAPDPAATVAKVTSTVKKAAAPVRRTSVPSSPPPQQSSAPSHQQTSPVRRATPVRSGSSPRVTSPRDRARRHARTGGGAVDRGRVASDRGRPRRGPLPVVPPPSRRVLATSLVHVAARPPVDVTSPVTDRRAPQLPDGCRTGSLDPSELRRCALASVLGPTGGLGAEIPLAGLLTLAVGAVLATRRPRASSVPA